MRSTRFLALIVATIVLLAGCGHQVPAAGEYEGPPLAAHSLESATVDVYLGFTCEPCQQLYASGEDQLRGRYGERLKLRNHYVLREHEIDAPMRLYLVAKDAGRGDRIADLLMRAQLSGSDEDKTLVLTNWVASQSGLSDAYHHALEDPDMNDRIRRAVAETREELMFMPALVLDRQMMFHDDIGNAQTILDSVLKPAKQ